MTAGAAVGQRVSAPPGTHFVRNDDYFNLHDEARAGSSNKDCKICLLQRWWQPGPEGMGTAGKSKTLQILTYDESLKNPVRTLIVLRCWALWQAGEAGWLDHSPVRRGWYTDEVEALRAEVANLGRAPGTTGSAAADVKINLWAPQVLSVTKRCWLAVQI
jgi:hypothetical protein